MSTLWVILILLVIGAVVALYKGFTGPQNFTGPDPQRVRMGAIGAILVAIGAGLCVGGLKVGCPGAIFFLAGICCAGVGIYFILTALTDYHGQWR